MQLGAGSILPWETRDRQWTVVARRLIERGLALVGARGCTGERGAGNEMVKLSTDEMELRTKYRGLYTL